MPTSRLRPRPAFGPWVISMGHANRLPEIEMLRLPQVDLPLEGKLLVVYGSMNPAAPERRKQGVISRNKIGLQE
jgi:hypothetical protein